MKTATTFNRAAAPTFAAAMAALLLGVTLVPAPALAQERSKRPVIGEHTFVPNPLTESPQPRTTIRQGLGVGQLLNLDLVPDFVIGEDTISGLKGDLLFATLEMEYQHAIKDWLAVWVEVALNARLGTDVGAILTEGATVLTGFELGWLVRLLENDRVALSATANVSNSNFTGINIFDWVEGIVDSVDVPLVRKTPSVRGAGGLRFAWAANEWLGILARGEAGYGESLIRTEGDQGFVRIAGAASVDLLPITPVPIGLSLGFENNSFPENGSDIADNITLFTLGVVYTGREDFTISLDNSWGNVSRKDADSVSSGSIVFGMRYYF